MKRRIRQNVWGNWNGYEGTRKVVEFGTDNQDAEHWLKTGEKPGQLDELKHNGNGRFTGFAPGPRGVSP